MKYSLFTVTFAGFWGQHRLTLEEAIDKTAELGFEGVEIMGKRPHLSPLDYSLEDCKRLREHLDQKGLKLAAIAGYTDFTGGMESAEVPFPEMQIAYVEALAQRAQILGGDLVRIFSSYERPGVAYTAQWQRTVNAIRECADRAGEYGVSVGIQNHHDIGADTKTLGEMLLQIDRPNVIPMYDCWSIHLRGEDIAQGVRTMAPKMRFTTVADYVVLPRTHYRAELVHYEELNPPAVFAVPMGEGELDYKTFFDELEKAGFDGWVSYEMCSTVRDGGELATLERYAKRFLEYMRNR
ncbi:MAG: sugar phosphate isomerase/epimerase [Candidatus Omnitrophica bacterium]|nr:sugar phosphate isomerase/epimerase [Candidatus Omnitrophota bacterium]